MGVCESRNNPTLLPNNNRSTNNLSSIPKVISGDDQVSFRCFYDVKNIDEEIRIISDYKDNKEIKSKIKILNNNKKEELIFTKKFNKIGTNTIDFIIEGKLTNMSHIFNKCKSLIQINKNNKS